MFGYANFIFQLVLLAAAIAYSIIAAKRARDKKDEDLEDVRRLATRGEFIPVGIGRFRTAGFFLWRQDRPPISVPASTSGKKPDPNGPSYHEYASQFLLVGEGRALYSIREDGITIFQGPITPTSHPSGTLVPTNGFGSFRIYWGERDQPLPVGGRDEHYGNSPNTEFRTYAGGLQGLESRMSGGMRIDWQPKVIPASRTWPRLDYEVDAMVVSGLSESPSVVPGAWDNTDQYTFGELVEAYPSLIGPNGGIYTGDPVLFTTPANPADESAFRILDGLGSSNQYSKTRFVRATCTANVGRPPWTCPTDFVLVFAPGSIVRLDDGTSGGRARGSVNGAVTLESFSRNPNPADTHRYFFVDRAEYDPALFTYLSGGTLLLEWDATVKIFLGPEIDPSTMPSLVPIGGPPASPFMRIVPVTQLVEMGGINAGHMVDQLMFAKWPNGAGLEQSFFDIDSLERVSRVLGPLGEIYQGAVALTRGENFRDVLQALMEDLGLMISFDPATGLYRFDLLRELSEEEVDELPFVPADATSRSEPGTRSLTARTGQLQSFVFADRTTNYQDLPIVVSTDGSRRIENRADIRQERILSTNILASAEMAATRRSKKALLTVSRVEFYGLREVRMLRPGVRFIHEQVDRVLFCVAIKRDPLTDEVRVRAAFDAYGGSVAGASPIEILDFGHVNRSGLESPGGSTPLFGLRFWELPVELTPGGARIVTLAARPVPTTAATRTLISGDGGLSWSEASKSPHFQALGVLTGDVGDVGAVDVDFGEVDDASDLVLDLTMSDADFDSGLQMLLVGDEVIFWDGVDGYLRGQLGTVAVVHEEGDEAWLVRQDQWLPWSHPMLRPGRTIHLKAVPMKADGRTAVSVDTAPVHVLEIDGSGLVRQVVADDVTEIASALRALGLIK
jgi:hypothetical protein